MRHLIAVVAVVLVLVLETGAALALPYNCSLRTTTRSVSAYCRSGTGYYRAAGKVRCNGSYAYIYGSWQRPGGFGESYRNAPSGCTVVAGYLQKKG